MIIFDSAAKYIECATSLQDKITRIDTIIDALLTTATKMAANDNISEYQLNDGQTQIKTVYKGSDGVMRSIQSFESLKQLYINKLNGRHMRLMDSKNLPGFGYGR